MIRAQRLLKKSIVVILLCVTVFGIVGCGSKEVKLPDIYNVGTYSGNGKGMNGNVMVSVTVNETKIEKIEVIEHNETPGISDPAIVDLPLKIIEVQSVEVDTMAGATLTSNGIKQAVEDALTKANLK